MDSAEACDDGNGLSDDGCSPTCAIEVGWRCARSPSTCTTICGDGLRRGAEACDDGTDDPSDGCTRGCEIRRGFECPGEGPLGCRGRCGDGFRLKGEACDDGNGADGDGCDRRCQIELGFECSSDATSVCESICGDGMVRGGETCDDGNERDGDGCSSTCISLLRWRAMPGGRPPRPRFGAASAWTGSEILVFGGFGSAGAGTLLDDGAAYRPDFGTWRPLSQLDAPSARGYAASVWTGRELIVWGGMIASEGELMFGDGARYNPVDDRWQSMSPSMLAPRSRAVAAWTGTEVVIFGGGDSRMSTLGDGARYDPVKDAWRGLSLEGAPSPRMDPSVVWTGEELIYFGGHDGLRAIAGGGAYNPANDRWRTLAIENAPSPRAFHSAIWTGTEMIVFGGASTESDWREDGARYDPASDTWMPLPTTRAPPATYGHQALWTGSEMLLVGGAPAAILAEYIPQVNAWRSVAPTVPSWPRIEATTFLANRRVLVWGGYDPATGAIASEGAMFDLDRAGWSTLPAAPEIEARAFFSALVVGEEMLIYGGASGSRTDVTTLASGALIHARTGAIRRISPTASPRGRGLHAAEWTGSEMLVFGGLSVEGVGPSDPVLEVLGDGARYDLARDRWSSMNLIGAPSPRSGPAHAWTGRELVIFGGLSDSDEALGDGALYDPARDQWRPMSLIGAPSPRNAMAFAWTGRELLVFGGETSNQPLGDGGRYDPALDRWIPIAPTPELSARSGAAAAWTGRELVLFGGAGEGQRPLGDGARYDPEANVWMLLPGAGAPEPRMGAEAVWTGAQVVVFGGARDAGDDLAPLGGRYDPALDAWFSLPERAAPPSRIGHAAVWIAPSMIVFGGAASSFFRSDGAFLDL